MMLDRGSWKGKQILSEDWVRKSVEPSQEFYPPYGLLWWLHFKSETVSITDDYINYYKTHGMTSSSIKKLEELKGKAIDFQTFQRTVFTIILGDEMIKQNLQELKDRPQLKPVVQGPLRSYEAQGYLGQILVVVPRDRIVAVRQRRGPGGHDTELELRRSFVDFADVVGKLADHPAGTKR
jgi:hypothetical protein